MGRVQGQGANAPGGLVSHPGKAVHGDIFGELMARALASAAPGASGKAHPAGVTPEPSEPDPTVGDAVATTRSSKAAADETTAPAESLAPAALPAGKRTMPAIARPAETALKFGETAPAADSARSADMAKGARNAIATAVQTAVQSSTGRAVQAGKAAGSTGAGASSVRKATSRTRVSLKMIPLPNLKPQPPSGIPGASPKPAPAAILRTEPSLTGEGDAQPGEVATTRSAKSSLVVAGTEIVAPKLAGTGKTMVSAPIVKSGAAPLMTKATPDHSPLNPSVSTESRDTDTLAASGTKSAAFPASKVLQQVQAENVRAGSSSPSLPVTGVSRSALTLEPSLVNDKGGVAAVAGALAHVPHAGASVSAAASSTGPLSAVSSAFARMDSAAPPQVIESAPQRLTVGVRDGGLGWVEIRTHAAAGQVSAVVATGTSEAHATLQAHLPELREYLTSQQVRVDQLASEPFASAGESRGSQQQEPGRSGPQHQVPGDSDRVPPATAAGENAEESLSYINVRV